MTDSWRRRAQLKHQWSMGSILTVSMASMLAVLVVAITFLDIQRERSHFREKAEQRGLSLAAGINDILANYIYHTRIDELRQMSEALESDPDIKYVNIFLPDGRLIVEINSDENKSSHPPGPRPARLT